MKKDKVCISKNVSFFVVGALLLIGFILFTSFIGKTNTTSNAKAADFQCINATQNDCKAKGCKGFCTSEGCNNGMYQCKTETPTPALAYNQCDKTKPCPANQYCQSLGTDGTLCVPDLKYSVLIASTSMGYNSDGTTYKKIDIDDTLGKGNIIYDSDNPSAVNLTTNKEYGLYFQYPYSTGAIVGDSWLNAYTTQITISGLNATQPTKISMDPKDPYSWLNKVFTFSSSGTGAINIALKRVDPSNGKILTRNWSIPINVKPLQISGGQ